MGVQLQNLNPSTGARYLRKDNAYKLTSFDHFALPTLSIELMAEFIIEVLGGEPYYYAGFDDTDREMGRKKHIFLRVGDVLMQCAEPQDGQLKINKNDLNSWPHWAFGTSAEGLDENMERFRTLGIPFRGPCRHRGIDVVSIYFATPEGHKLEICTWDPYPEEKTILLGAKGVGHINWEELFYHWPI